MRAVNLYLLTRTTDQETVSSLYRALSEQYDHKMISPHEAASLKSLADLIVAQLSGTELPEEQSLLSCLDGFYFSYVIEHIGKEFDLLKISEDGDCILNIELKSEEIEEDRIKKQLEQNRYYLTHIAHTIYSYTYVKETEHFYCLNDRGHFRQCNINELIDILQRPALGSYLAEGIDRFFRASDYLISPIASPDKFLQGQYFLTNQQFDFKKKILACLKSEKSEQVISVSGSAGTGKTLLLFDLAMELSRKETVLLLHSGPLRKGHMILNERLRKVAVRSASVFAPGKTMSEYACLLIDETDHLPANILQTWLDLAAVSQIPVILTYDPHLLLEDEWQEAPSAGTIELIEKRCTLSLSFTGNIRINRPVYAFLRTLLHPKNHGGYPDYSCIDILYADSTKELRLLTDYYDGLGYTRLNAGSDLKNAAVIAQEYDRVLMVLDKKYYYDDTLHLHVDEDTDDSLKFLYEGLSRTREKLCLIILANRNLFSQILAIKLHLPFLPGE